jgi:catechol-2,3-dioxygenase
MSKKGPLASLKALFKCHSSAKSQAITNKLSAKPILISEIKLQTTTPMADMVAFYGDLIGLSVLNTSEASCSFKAGESVLTFIICEQTEEDPFYHFAFNIPENKIREAEEWQVKKTALINPPNRLKDMEQYGNNVVFFKHWNAHAIFFYDPAGNVVEYIARHELDNASSNKFSVSDILCISEIGLVVTDVFKSSAAVKQHFNLSPYSNQSKVFMALGNEQGLILFFDKDTQATFGAGRNRGVFDTEVVLSLEEDKTALQVLNYPYNIKSL